MPTFSEVSPPANMGERDSDHVQLPLEPKYTSLLWLIAHAAVHTATLISHMVPDFPRNCQLCPNSDETILHYFWSCPQVQRFWLLVSRFLHNIQQQQQSNMFTVNIESVVNGFGNSGKSLPNPDVLHGLAIWEIYRSHAELSMDNICLTGDAMFMRWKSSV
ncbi:hypothetical protein FB639_005779, partial [Coemansia asiatica]